MEIYILGSLLGLGYFLNQSYEPAEKHSANPKSQYRGNIYDHAQYDKVENEVMDRATVKMREAGSTTSAVSGSDPVWFWNRSSCAAALACADWFFCSLAYRRKAMVCSVLPRPISSARQPPRLNSFRKRSQL